MLYVEVVLSNIKEDLNISDDLQDGILERLIIKVMDHFKLAYNQTEIAEKYSFIIEDCVIKRFNRRGAEGAVSESVEGYSMTYEDYKYEFMPYDEILKRDFNQSKARLGEVYFL